MQRLETEADPPRGKDNNKDKAESKCGFFPFDSLKVKWDEQVPSFLVRVRAQMLHPKTGVYCEITIWEVLVMVHELTDTKGRDIGY
jgi:hypothetical protein